MTSRPSASELDLFSRMLCKNRGKEIEHKRFLCGPPALIKHVSHPQDLLTFLAVRWRPGDILCADRHPEDALFMSQHSRRQRELVSAMRGSRAIVDYKALDCFPLLYVIGNR
jgi:hypothetical protein